MKLLVAIIANDDANKIQKALVEMKISSTRLATTSGFLRSRNATFIIGCKDEEVDIILSILEENTKRRITTVPNTIVNEFGAFSAIPVQVEVGGATVFLLDVEKTFKF